MAAERVNDETGCIHPHVYCTYRHAHCGCVPNHPESKFRRSFNISTLTWMQFPILPILTFYIYETLLAFSIFSFLFSIENYYYLYAYLYHTGKPRFPNLFVGRKGQVESRASGTQVSERCGPVVKNYCFLFSSNMDKVI